MGEEGTPEAQALAQPNPLMRALLDLSPRLREQLRVVWFRLEGLTLEFDEGSGEPDIVCPLPRTSWRRVLAWIREVYAMGFLPGEWWDGDDREGGRLTAIVLRRRLEGG